MKITIDIDCTPQEARTFLGLPHIEPMQDALIAQMQERLSGYLGALEPEQLMKLWLPGGMQGLAEIQERFWRQLMGGMGGGAAGEPPRGKKPKE
jgi:hypothetical protein